MTNRYVRSLILSIAALVAVQANATVVNTNRLQNGLNNITVGSDFYDVNNDQLGADQVWAIGSSSASIARLIFEFAGYANANAFGIYDIYDPSNRLKVFDGSKAAGALEITDLRKGNKFVNMVNGEYAIFGSRMFGYYLDGPGGTFFSQSSLNPGQADQMIAFQGRDDIYVDASGSGPGLFLSGEYILAWEDLPITRSDRDFTDFVVLVESVTPVPAPATLALLGLALAGLGAARRRA